MQYIQNCFNKQVAEWPKKAYIVLVLTLLCVYGRPHNIIECIYFILFHSLFDRDSVAVPITAAAAMQSNFFKQNWPNSLSFSCNPSFNKYWKVFKTKFTYLKVVLAIKLSWILSKKINHSIKQINTFHLINLKIA